MSDCTPWTGAKNRKGYGTRTINGRPVLAHRQAYIDAYGEPASGLHIHHECGNRACVNPAHLKAVTPLEHNRGHSGTGLGDEIDRIMADGGWWAPRDVRARLAGQASPAAVLMAIRRGVERGEYERRGYGWYRRVVA